MLNAAGITTRIDDTDNYTPGQKMKYWWVAECVCVWGGGGIAASGVCGVAGGGGVSVVGGGGGGGGGGGEDRHREVARGRE